MEYSTMRRRARCTNRTCPAHEPVEIPLPLVRPGFAMVPRDLLCLRCGEPAEILASLPFPAGPE